MIRSYSVVLVLAGILAGTGTAPGASSGAAVKAAFERQLPSINLPNVTLRDALAFLNDVSGANVHVNWKAIEAAGVSPDTTINLRLRNVSFRKVLSTVLTEAAGGPNLTFFNDEGVIEITSREAADSVLYT